MYSLLKSRVELLQKLYTVS